jgi:hypothetical protein
MNLLKKVFTHHVPTNKVAYRVSKLSLDTQMRGETQFRHENNLIVDRQILFGNRFILMP